MDSSGQPPQYEVLPPQDAARSNQTHSNWSFLSAPATYILVGINVAVYLFMVLRGVSATNPTPEDLIRFGANSPYHAIVFGQWWRLVTATFVHVGIVHMAMNMWCLWNLGLLGEPLLGRRGMIAVYVLTGVAGNLLSTVVNVVMRVESVGAGASGAVFGLAGILIVLLSNRRLGMPWEELKKLRASVIQFAVLNLAIGMGTFVLRTSIQIDNMAHLGGFLSGLAMGVPLLSEMTKGRKRYLARQKYTFGGAAFILSLIGYGISKLG